MTDPGCDLHLPLKDHSLLQTPLGWQTHLWLLYEEVIDSVLETPLKIGIGQKG